MISSVYLGVFFCATIYIIAGTVGYLCYGNELEDILISLLNDLRIYKSTDKFLLVLLLVVSFSFLVSSTMSIPLMFIGLKKNFLNTVIFCKKKFFINQNKQEIIDNMKPYEEDMNTNLLDPETKNTQGMKKYSSNNLKYSDSNNQEIDSDEKNNDNSSNYQRKISEVSMMSNKSKIVLIQKMESKYITEQTKNIIIIILFLSIVAMTILIKSLSTVSFYNNCYNYIITIFYYSYFLNRFLT